MSPATFAVAGIVAYLVQQVSPSTGTPAPSVAMTSVVNPLVGILVGTLLLTRATEEAKVPDAVDVEFASVATRTA